MTTRYYAANPTALRLSVSALVRREGDARDIALMRRSDNGLWGVPGGYVELGEAVAEATRREVEEETGFRVEVGRLIGVYSDPARQVIAYSPDDRIQAVNLCFKARALSEGLPTTPEETLESGFFPQAALPEPLVPIHDVRIADALAEGREAAVR